MPSVGMRRTTRVFGVVKGADAARVLRSGRRLWPESGEGKTRRGNDGDDWLKLDKTTGKGDVWSRGVVKSKQEVTVIDTQKDVGVEMTKPIRKVDSVSEGNVPDRMFGIVYTRKRKRLDVDISKLAAVKGDRGDPKDKMFGLQFSRRQRRKKDDQEEVVSSNRGVLAVVVKPSCGQSYWFSRFLFLVLRYVKRVRITLKELLSFVLSEPYYGTYALRGIHFLQGPPSTNLGVFHFFGITGFVPLFSVDFSAVPLCFKFFHSAMLLRSIFRSFFLVNSSIYVHSNVEMDSSEYQSEDQISYCSFERGISESGNIAPVITETNESLLMNASVKNYRLSGRSGQYRNILNSRGIPRRKSSLRKRKARNPSLVGVHKANGALASDLVDGRKRSFTFTGVRSSKKLRSLSNSCSTGIFKEERSAVVDSVEGFDSSICSTNILITESDKCCRVEGAIVTLEISASGEWLLTVKKDGLTRCTLKAEKVMRPYSSNRFTHAIMFSLDNGWKLEFVNRQDWIIFKDLYKECSDHSIPAPVAKFKFIPVPGMREVSGYGDSNIIPFYRPDTYISVNGDELSRALAKRTANYDMDSEDEQWLNKFNHQFGEHVSEDNFELIIDALEKAHYCNPDDFFDEKSASNLCRGLGSKEGVEAVYSYWMKKRKQKRASLLRVFQGYQSKRAPLIPKPLLRKRRSLKRQPSQFGRGKQPSVLQAIAAEQGALEEKNAILRVDEAKTAANKSMELSILKRKRAQLLMENADLATYKAAMLVRIAEAAQAAESTDTTAGYFLD